MNKVSLVRASLLSILLIAGCSLSMNRMQEVFAEDLRLTVGRSLEELQYHETAAFIGKRKPTDRKRMDNGNLLLVYGDYWGQYGIKREACTVFLEFDSVTMRVVKATAEGDGCYSAY